jgi:hypothetical protein
VVIGQIAARSTALHLLLPFVVADRAPVALAAAVDAKYC